MKTIPLLALVVFAACASSPKEVDDSKRLTTGVVQREIKKGMASASVAEALGSPNIVSTDEEGREVWVYERFAREVRGGSSNYWVLFVWGSKTDQTTTQRTLTVIVKFDEKGRVRDVAYHSSSF